MTVQPTLSMPSVTMYSTHNLTFSILNFQLNIIRYVTFINVRRFIKVVHVITVGEVTTFADR